MLLFNLNFTSNNYSLMFLFLCLLKFKNVSIIAPFMSLPRNYYALKLKIISNKLNTYLSEMKILFLLVK